MSKDTRRHQSRTNCLPQNTRGEDPAGPGAQPTILGPRGQEGPQGTILEDDQQLYDWGIENRLDQYTYQVGDYVEIILLI